jgi:hypothetical protein
MARIVAFGLLHLDHFGAEIARDLPGEQRGDAVTEFDHHQSCQGALSGFIIGRSAFLMLRLRASARCAISHAQLR